MATHDDRSGETPTGPMPRRFIRIGIGGLVVLLVLLVVILASNLTRSAPSRHSQTSAPRADSIVQTPPATPRSRPEPLSVETGQRPSFRDPRGDPIARSAAIEQAQTPVDPLAAERKKRDFDSLYAGNVVVSYRPGETTGRRSDAPRRTVDGAPELPSTDDVVASVMRAVGGGAGRPALPGVPPDPGSGRASQSPAPGRTVAAQTETPPLDDSGPTHRVLESSIIDAVIVNRLDGGNDSPVIAKVTNPLYSHNGAYVLIPADTKIVGETRAVRQVGESRLVVVFHRLIFPNGSTKSLDQFKGLHVSGALGLKDHVNNHYVATFGAAAAMSVVTGAGQAIATRGLGGANGGTTVIAGSMGDGIGQATSQVLNRFLNRLPTITIREGNRFKVYITDDIELPAYPSTR